MIQPSFHNTIGETGATLAQSEETAQTQEQRILSFYKAHPKGWYTPWDIQAYVLPSSEITSVRRAITNLEQRGKLVKSHEANAMGKHGKMNHQWALCHGQVQQTLF